MVSQGLCSFRGNPAAVITFDLSHFHSLCSPLPQATILHSVAGKCSVIRVRHLETEPGLVRNASRSGVCESAALLVPGVCVCSCLSCCVEIRVLMCVFAGACVGLVGGFGSPRSGCVCWPCV